MPWREIAAQCGNANTFADASVSPAVCQLTSSPSKRSLKVFCRYFIPGLFLVGALSTALLVTAYKFQRKRAEERCENLVTQASKNLDIVSGVTTNPLRISLSSPIHDAAFNATDDALALVRYEFVQYSKYFPYIAAISYVDATSGMELARVSMNWNGSELLNVTATGSDDLQNVSSTEYFAPALTLGRGEVYVSRMQLNFNMSDFGLPYGKVIYSAAAVYADHSVAANASAAADAAVASAPNCAASAGRVPDDETPKGIIMVTLRAQRFLQAVTTVMESPSYSYNPMYALLNADGYYLEGAGISEDDTFGFDKPSHEPTFAERYPDVWAKLNARTEEEPFGQYYDGKYLVTYKREDRCSYADFTTVAICISDSPMYLVIRDRWEDIDPSTIRISRITTIVLAVLATVLWLVVSVAFARSTIVHDALMRREIGMQVFRSKNKELWLAVVCHELRSPLNVIIGAIDLMDGPDLPPGKAQILQLLRNSADMLAAVVNDVLDISKIEAGLLELDPQPFRPRAEIEGCTDVYAIAALRKGLDVYLSFDKGVPEIAVADMPRIRQILSNLLSNAVKFTATGSITVTVRVVEILLSSQSSLKGQGQALAGAGRRRFGGVGGSGGNSSGSSGSASSLSGGGAGENSCGPRGAGGSHYSSGNPGGGYGLEHGGGGSGGTDVVGAGDAGLGSAGNTDDDDSMHRGRGGHGSGLGAGSGAGGDTSRGGGGGGVADGVGGGTMRVLRNASTNRATYQWLLAPFGRRSQRLSPPKDQLKPAAASVAAGLAASADRRRAGTMVKAPGPGTVSAVTGITAPLPDLPDGEDEEMGLSASSAVAAAGGVKAASAGGSLKPSAPLPSPARQLQPEQLTGAGTAPPPARPREPSLRRILLEVSVTDTGKGIAPARQGNVWQPYTQEDAGSTREHGGTGLGLTISKRLVELMGGNITLESVVDRGTTFCVRVPVTVAEGPPVFSPPPSTLLPPVPPGWKRGSGSTVVGADEGEAPPLPKVGAPKDVNEAHVAALRDGTAAAGGDLVLFPSHARLVKNVAAAAVGLPGGDAGGLEAVVIDSQGVSHGLPRMVELMREGLPNLQVLVLLGSRWVHLLGSPALNGCHVLSMPVTPAKVAGALQNAFAKLARERLTIAVAESSPESGVAGAGRQLKDRHCSVSSSRGGHAGGSPSVIDNSSSACDDEGGISGSNSGRDDSGSGKSGAGGDDGGEGPNGRCNGPSSSGVGSSDPPHRGLAASLFPSEPPRRSSGASSTSEVPPSGPDLKDLDGGSVQDSSYNAGYNAGNSTGYNVSDNAGNSNAGYNAGNTTSYNSDQWPPLGRNTLPPLPNGLSAPAHGHFLSSETGGGDSRAASFGCRPGSDGGGCSGGVAFVGSFGSIGGISGTGVSGGGGRRRRMLVVDDTSANRRILAHQLELLGHEADMAADGSEAVQMEAAAEPPYDCILLDLHMPGMDGVDVSNAITARYEGTDPAATAAASAASGGGSSGTPAARARAAAAAAAAPAAAAAATAKRLWRAGRSRPAIVIVTASALSSDRERCEAAGVDGFVTKPVNKRRLVECLNAVLHTNQRASAA